MNVMSLNHLKTVVKRDGSEIKFDFERIRRSVQLAGRDTKAYYRQTADKIAMEIAETLAAHKGPKITTQEIRDIVEPAIAQAGYFQTAKYYILYGFQKSQQPNPVPADIQAKFEESKSYFTSPLSEFVYFKTYSKWIDELGRRETWPETMQRYMDFMEENLGDNLSKRDYKDIHEAILNQKVVPSMRLVWSAGKAARDNNISAYNCSYVAPSRFEDFGEIMYLLMCGTGVGFSVEEKTVAELPMIKEQTGKKEKTLVVEDSKEGWAEAFIRAMKIWYDGRDVEIDYSLIRPHGARLTTMGGRAAGPEALRAAMDFARETILTSQGRQLSTLDVHDIVCKIGEIVVAGGVRQSSLISLSDLDDELMRHAKDGQFYNTEPQRVMANNSAIYEHKPGAVEFLEEWLSLAKSGSGERGIFNRGGLQKQLPERRWKMFEKHAKTAGTNPCGEIVLRSRQFCNLTSVVVRAEDTLEMLKEKIRLATILGTYQATLTKFPFLTEDWKKNCEEEALLGVSITGYWDNKEIRDEKVLAELRDYAVEVNKKFAKKFGINQSTCVTCIKPSGNSSQLLDTASGMHPRFSKYYVRRVRLNSADPMCQMMMDQGVPYHPEVGQDPNNATTWVFEFPVKAPRGAVTKDDLSAVELLNHWKLLKVHFTEHNPSATIYVGEDEWLDVAHWVYENWDQVGGLSFLPRTEHVYQLAPYEAIDRAEYLRLQRKMEKIDFAQLYVYEQEDKTEGAQELACVSGACEI